MRSIWTGYARMASRFGEIGVIDAIGPFPRQSGVAPADRNGQSTAPGFSRKASPDGSGSR